MISRKKLAIYLTFTVSAGLVALCLYSRQSFWYLSIFNPERIYSPLVKERISFTKKNKYYFSYSNKFEGLYLIEIFLDKPPKYIDSIKTSARVSVTIKDRSGVKKKIDHVEWAEKFGSDKNGGVIVGSYWVPKEINLDSELVVIVDVKKPDPDFSKKYGVSHIVIKRAGNL